MNKKYLLAIPVCLFFLVQEPENVVAQDDCEVVNIPSQCQNGSRVNINANSRNISPRNLCMAAGESFDVNVTPNGRTAIIRSKTGESWLNGGGESFRVDIPAGTSGDFDYEVRFDDGYCIDPRISVD